ncbi:tail completion protein gp17 [Sphingomonas hengshuiensis]|uniref:DUF3168 domain-containing protein n=1 Tax=Sphingomonas hengshuiensis TaxID=1609977 RepID=A0A7U4JAB2_9SPHN|nr:DUF3168 domain-containing protein [Sphingomonas hengshuiensis]AJP73131.1 hypothetical protein TS85_17015 [Sphingomonas hengshuiensis]
MSVQGILQEALRAALAGHAPLAGAVTAIFDAPPVRAARPYALIDEAVLVDWGTKDMAGREGRIAVRIFDSGERPVRLRGLAGAAEDAVAAMPVVLGEGWRIASLVLLRSRIVREGEARWVATSEWRVRLLRSG